MKCRLALVLLVLIAATMFSGLRSASAGAVSGPVGHLTGFFWEDGGLEPPLVIGDEIHMVGTFEGDPLFFPVWEPEKYVYTFWIHGLLASREYVIGDSRRVFYDGPGKLEIYRELWPGNHDYGSDPPNATSPSTFTDGELALECDVSYANVWHNDAVGQSSADIDYVTYVGGALLDEVLAQCGACEAWASGGASTAGVPAGYDRRWNGVFQNWFTFSVEPQSWGGVKGLYR